jgi:hypothetical protein
MQFGDHGLQLYISGLPNLTLEAILVALKERNAGLIRSWGRPYAGRPAYV